MPSEKFLELISKMPDSEIDLYLTQYMRYERSAMQAVFQELENRGRPVNKAETDRILSEIVKRDEERANDRSSWDKNAVVDGSAPALFSEKAIFGFSMFFSPLFGAALLVANLRQLGRKEGQVITINIGLFFAAVAIYLFDKFHDSTYIYAWNAGGALVLTRFIWPRSIGNELKYRKKPIWMALLVSIVITAGLLWINLSSQ